MRILDIILSLEVIAGILIAASLAMAVRALLNFTRESATMGPKLHKLESDLQKLRDGMREREKTVKDLTVIVEPLREREGRIRAYYDALKDLEVETERESQKTGEEQEAAKKRRIQRKKMGIDEEE